METNNNRNKAQEKAKELVELFADHANNSRYDTVMEGLPENYRAKECALICVNQLKANSTRMEGDRWHSYWCEVERELNKL